MTEEYRALTIKDKLAFFAMIIGMFMAVLDIQIVASSLSTIGSGLSATQDELSWVQTSYIIAEAIVIPITGFLARLLSTRVSFFLAAFGFTIMSAMCALAWNIESMIVFRALQGLFGGAMIPTVFATIFIIFPPKSRHLVTMIIGLTVTIAPTLGPTIGGYITEVTSWHFLFLINVLPGAFVCITVLLYANFDEPNHGLLHNFDYLGIILLALSLGSLQYILEEGVKEGWFDSILITFLTSLSALSFIGMLIRELTSSNPIIDLSAFKNKNFALGCIYTFILGIGLYGTIYLLPLFLAWVINMDTLQIGIAMSVGGAFRFISAPIAAKLYATRINKRFMIGIGFGLFAFGCYLGTGFTPDWGYNEMFMPQAFMGFAMMFCFIPINNLALGSIPKSKIQNASGLFNLMRNLGGGVGLAVINSFLITNTKIVGQYLNDNITITDPNVITAVDSSRAIFDGKVWDAQLAAISMINKTVQRDAFIITLNEILTALTAMFIFGIIMLFFTDDMVEGEEVAAH